VVVASVLEVGELDTIDVGTVDAVVEEFVFATPKPTLTDVAYGIQRKRHTDWT